MNRTISREDIFSAAEASGFQRIEACCEGVQLKACSNDVWKGEVVAFVAELERIGGIGWQQAATWLCQHHTEFTDMGSLIKAMREAAPAASHPSQPAVPPHQSIKFATTAWTAYWAGSGPYKGWAIKQGRDEVVWFGETISSEAVEAIVMAHNQCIDCNSETCVMNCSGRTGLAPQPSQPAASEAAQDAKDAKRYRWLRDISEPGICAFYLSVGKAFDGVKFKRATVDEAIDAQIERLGRAEGER